MEELRCQKREGGRGVEGDRKGGRGVGWKRENKR